MKTSEKLQKRLLDDLGLETELPCRVPRGFHGRCSGQWAWMARRKKGAGDIGSEDTMSDCVKADELTTYTPDWDISLHICAEFKEQPND